jgi:hypothetical protein
VFCRFLFCLLVVAAMQFQFSVGGGCSVLGYCLLSAVVV